MRCQKCSTDNPDTSRFCYNCGVALLELEKSVPFQPDYPKRCLKCNTMNPLSGKYCYECGDSLEEPSLPESHQCPTCGITMDSTQFFCPNCGQSFVEKPQITKTKTIPVHSVETHVECPACGQLTIGGFCRNCGFNLLVKQRKNATDWWYCDRDSAIMREIDPNNQILVSRVSLDESLAQAIDNQILQRHDREKARLIAQQTFRESKTNNFEVLSQIKCPVCGNQSLAPASKNPRQSQSFLRKIAFNGGYILRNGLYYLRNYPVFLLIITFSIMIDIVIIFTGLIPFSEMNPHYLTQGGSTLVGTIYYPYYEFNLVLLLISITISFVATTYFQCWYNTVLKEIRHGQQNSPNYRNAFLESVRVFPRVIIAQLFVFGIRIIILFGYIYMIEGNIFLYAFEIYPFLLSGLISFLFIYINMSLVFDEDKSIILSIKRSLKFTRKYFWTTIGIFAVFSAFSYATTYIQPFLYLLTYNLPFFIILVIFSIMFRSLEAYRAVSVGWSYDEFKHTIETNESHLER